MQLGNAKRFFNAYRIEETIGTAEDIIVAIAIYDTIRGIHQNFNKTEIAIADAEEDSDAGAKSGYLNVLASSR